MGGWDDFIGGLKDVGGVIGGVFDKVNSGPMHLIDKGADVITHTEDTLGGTISNVSSNLYADTTTAGSTMTGYTISNFEVVYNIIDFGQEIQRQIISESPKIRIKSSSYNTSVSPIASATSGAINLIYNLRYASVKSAYLNIGGSATNSSGGTTSAGSANKNMDSIDLTSSAASINVIVFNSLIIESIFEVVILIFYSIIF
jgi:hypothetical protein